jgi:predicted transcriptional regulator
MTDLSVTIRGEAARRLAELADLSGRTPEWFANFMIEEHADEERALVLELKRAVASADAGNTVSHEEAMRSIREAIDGARRTAAE